MIKTILKAGATIRKAWNWYSLKSKQCAKEQQIQDHLAAIKRMRDHEAAKKRIEQQVADMVYLDGNMIRIKRFEDDSTGIACLGTPDSSRSIRG